MGVPGSRSQESGFRNENPGGPPLEPQRLPSPYPTRMTGIVVPQPHGPPEAVPLPQLVTGLQPEDPTQRDAWLRGHRGCAGPTEDQGHEDGV